MTICICSSFICHIIDLHLSKTHININRTTIVLKYWLNTYTNMQICYKNNHYHYYHTRSTKTIYTITLPTSKTYTKNTKTIPTQNTIAKMTATTLTQSWPNNNKNINNIMIHCIYMWWNGVVILAILCYPS